MLILFLLIKQYETTTTTTTALLWLKLLHIILCKLLVPEVGRGKQQCLQTITGVHPLLVHETTTAELESVAHFV
jgi:hypothetical protein